jgi:cardiolipin synthase
VESTTGSEVIDRGLWTVPNAISVGRLCCIPVFLYLLFGRHDRLGAAWLLAALGATDWVDGYLARRFAQVSELGKILDPLADRLLFIVGIGGIVIDRSAPVWFSVLVIVREAALGATLVALTLAGMKRFDVTFAGKSATFALMFAFPLFLLSAAGGPTAHWWELLAWLCGIPGLVLSYYTAFAYIPQMRSSLRAGRLEREKGRGR